jgi:hypothetical protein
MAYTSTITVCFIKATNRSFNRSLLRSSTVSVSPFVAVLLNHSSIHHSQSELTRDADEAAALRIQRLWRGYTDRQYLLRLQYVTPLKAATSMQPIH